MYNVTEYPKINCHFRSFTDTGLEGVPELLSFRSAALVSKDSLFPTDVTIIPLILVSS